ncbi:MAG: hypothetical protein ACREQC_17135, partial [Candidatus Binataceae bacterium]
MNASITHISPDRLASWDATEIQTDCVACRNLRSDCRAREPCLPHRYDRVESAESNTTRAPREMAYKRAVPRSEEKNLCGIAGFTHKKSVPSPDRIRDAVNS